MSSLEPDTGESLFPPGGPVGADVLILAAHRPDLVGLRSTLSEQLDGVVRGLHVLGKTVGLGMPVAGGSSANRVARLAPRSVILLGTCGVYPGLAQYRPHDVMIASKLHLIDHAVLAGRAMFPEPMQTTLETHSLLAAGLCAAGQRTRIAPVATCLSITSDDALAAHVHKSTGCEGETLEAFAVAHACHAAQVPFAAVLGVTHIVGSRGRDDWRQFHRQSVVAAAEVVVSWIHNGAQGLPHV